jgi:hypothetical protein
MQLVVGKQYKNEQWPSNMFVEITQQTPEMLYLGELRGTAAEPILLEYDGAGVCTCDFDVDGKDAYSNWEDFNRKEQGNFQLTRLREFKDTVIEGWLQIYCNRVTYISNKDFQFAPQPVGGREVFTVYKKNDEPVVITPYTLEMYQAEMDRAKIIRKMAAGPISLGRSSSFMHAHSAHYNTPGTKSYVEPEIMAARYAAFDTGSKPFNDKNTSPTKNT